MQPRAQSARKFNSHSRGHGVNP